MPDKSESSNDTSSATSENNFGHDYSQAFRSPEGYCVCSDCGARENTDKSARKCARLVFPLTEDWEVSRRMIEDRARAELLRDLELAATPDDQSDEIVEGAEYWILDPRFMIPTSVLACVQDLQKPGVVIFTVGSEERGYQVHTRRRDTFNLGRALARMICLRNAPTGKEPR